MPALEHKDRRQRALLWEVGDYDEFSELASLPPVDLRVTWIAKAGDMTGPKGQLVSTDAQVSVDREISIGAKMWLAPNSNYSALQQFLGTGSAGDPTIMEVVAYNESPDQKNRHTERTVGLVRHSNTAPVES